MLVPLVERYRRINVSARGFANAVWRHAHARELLAMVGWVIPPKVDAIDASTSSSSQNVGAISSIPSLSSPLASPSTVAEEGVSCEDHIELVDATGAQRLLDLVCAHPYDPTSNDDGTRGAESMEAARQRIALAEQARLAEAARARKREQDEERRRVITDIQRDRARQTNEQLFDAIRGGRIDTIRSMLNRNPELVTSLDGAGGMLTSFR